MTKVLYIALCIFFISSYSSAMKKTEYPDDPEVQAFFDEFNELSRKKREKEKQKQPSIH